MLSTKWQCLLCQLHIPFFFPKQYLQVSSADELDPLWHGLLLNEVDGDALFHHLLHVALVVCGAKLDVVVLCNQLHVFILVKDATHLFIGLFEILLLLLSCKIFKIKTRCNCLSWILYYYYMFLLFSLNGFTGYFSHQAAVKMSCRKIAAINFLQHSCSAFER